MPSFPVQISSKLPGVGTTIFTTMSKLATEHSAINLSQGFPDFDCNPKLSTLMGSAIKNGHNQYAPMPGLLTLRESIAQKIFNLYSAIYNPDTEITITAGATQAIYTAITSIVKEGDEVIVFEPAYDSYLPAIKLCGGTPVFIPLKFPNYEIDWDYVKKSIRQKTKLIIINTPNNPTTSILNAKDLEKLEKLLRNTNIIVLSDEVYEHIIYDGYEHQSVCRFPKLAERSFIVSSFGKTYHTTGWKVGYCVAPKELMDEFRKVHQFNVFSVNTPAQYVFTELLKDKNLYLELSAFYTQKRNLFKNLLKGSRFTLMECAGTYFQLVRYNAISDEKDIDFAVRLTKEFKVASVPLSVFYHKPEDNKVLRFCFAKKIETLEKAAEILQKI
ncbi:MAG: methionine aminotransferase [Bacteroidia bacterium]|nr:methionine aminotransferase [Bacteroidia bacterium]